MATEMPVSLEGFSLKAFLRSPLTLFLLAGLYPAVFLLSRNWFVYTAGEAWLLIIGTSAASMLPGSLLLAAGKRAARLPVWKRLSCRLPGAGRVAGDGLCVLYACMVCFFLLQATIFIRYDPMWLKAAMYLFVAGLLVLVVAVTGLQTLTMMLAVMIVMAGFGWVGSWQRARKTVPVNWNTADRERIERLAFARKPNVYLIHLESYQSQEAMRTLYGFDNQEFLGQLERIGFSVFPSHFANYPWTLVSISSMLAMRHHYQMIAMGNDDALVARRLVGGKEVQSGAAGVPEQRLRVPDRLPGRLLLRAGRLVGLLLPRAELRQGLRHIPERPPRPDDRRGPGPPFWCQGFRRAPQRADRRRRREPEAVLQHPRAGGDGPLADRQELGRTSLLGGGVPADHPEGKSRLPRIGAGDRPAGPRGGRHHLRRPRGVSVPQGVARSRRANAILARNGVRGSTLALDLFGAFLAVRYPAGDTGRFRGTSHVNVLRVLLAALSGDDAFLSTAVEDQSYFRKVLQLYVAARDGTPLDAWEEVKP